MRVIFMGTPEFAVPALMAISNGGFELAAVYTREPARGGRRGLEIRKTPVHEAADSLGVPVFTPRTLRDAEVQKAFRELAADVAVVAAYGLILPVPVLEAPRLGCLNLHASLLPRWRGAAPIQRAIMAGDKETGVDVMLMEAGLDTGPVGLREIIPLRPDDTAGDSHEPPFRGRRAARGQRPQARSKPANCSSSHNPPPAPATPAKSRRARRRSTGLKPRRPSATRSTGSRPRPAPFPGS